VPLLLNLHILVQVSVMSEILRYYILYFIHFKINFCVCHFRHMQADEARKLRVRVNGFLDLLTLVIQTIADFDICPST